MAVTPEDGPMDTYLKGPIGLMHRIEEDYGVTVELIRKTMCASLLKDLGPIDSLDSHQFVGTDFVLTQELVALIVTTNIGRPTQAFAILRLRQTDDEALDGVVSHAISEVGFNEHEPMRVDDPRNELRYRHSLFNVRIEPGNALIIEPTGSYNDVTVLTKPKEGSTTAQKQLRGAGSVHRTNKSRNNHNPNTGHLSDHYKFWLVPQILDQINVEVPEVTTEEPIDTLF